MAIVRESVGTWAAFGTTAPAPLPSGTVAGNVLVAVWVVRQSLTTDEMTLPSGWTQGAFVTQTGGPTIKLAYKVAGSSEPATYSFVTTSTVNQSVGIARYSGVNTATIGDVSASTSSGASGTTLTATSINTVTNGAMVIAAFGNNVNTVAITGPADLAQAWGITNQARNTMGDGTKATAGATGSKTATQAATAQWASVLWALRPAGAAPAADVTITITSTEIAVSKMEPAVTWVTSGPNTWGKASWPNTKTNGATMYAGQSIHIFPFGLSEPWSQYQSVPSNPAPTSGLNYGTTSSTGLLHGALSKMEEFSAGGAKHMKVYGAPWWMKHKWNGSTFVDLTAADMYDNDSRVKFSRLGDWLYMAKQAAKLAMAPPFNVRWFSIWNELKGFWQGGSSYNVSMNSGADGNGMGYSDFYRRTSEAILAGAAELRAAGTNVPDADIKIGGPYNVIRARSGTGSAVSSNNPYAQYLYNRPWGYMDNGGYLEIETFLNNVVSQNLRFDFLSVDGADYNKGIADGNPPLAGAWPATDDWTNGLRWHDWHLWLRATMNARGLTNRVIVWDEYYRYPVKTIYAAGTTRDNYDAALNADFLRFCVLDNVQWPQAWGPWQITFGGSRVPQQLTAENTTSGSQPTPYGNATALFKTHFPPGTSVRESTPNTNSVLAIATPTHCIVINKLDATQTVSINGGAAQTVAPYEVTALPYSIDGYVLVADSRSYTLTGQAAALRVTRKLVAATRTFALAGMAANLERGRRMVASGTSFAVVGQSARLLHGFEVTAVTSAFAFSGQAATLRHAYRLVASSGAYILTGSAATFRRTYRLPANHGAYGLTGIVVALIRQPPPALGALVGSFALTAPETRLLVAHRLVAAQGTFAPAGQTALLRRGYPLAASAVTLALNGQATTLRVARRMAIAQDVFALVAQDATLARTVRLAASTGAYALTGMNATLTYGALSAYVLVAAIGTYILSGQAAGLSWSSEDVEPVPAERIFVVPRVNSERGYAVKRPVRVYAVEAE